MSKNDAQHKHRWMELARTVTKPIKMLMGCNSCPETRVDKA